jgi:pimeloyl-ACP methyl ester carboxylesterase
MIEIRCSDVKSNGVTLHLAEAGPSDGPVLCLLHGPPEYWRAWAHYSELFATAGWGERDSFGAANLRRKAWVYAFTEGLLIIPMLLP